MIRPVNRIIHHYGQDHQYLKLKEEQLELLQAIRNKDRENIIEELADNLVLCAQFAGEYKIGLEEILKVANDKIKRTYVEMETGGGWVVLDKESYKYAD